MRISYRLLALAGMAASSLTGCDSRAPEAPPAGSPAIAAAASQAANPSGAPGDAQLPPAPASPTVAAQDDAVLANRDCRAVADAYVGAIELGGFDFAARFWADPVIDGARLSGLFAGYVTPRIEIADIQEEGAAGSLFCTISGSLVDASDPRIKPIQGEFMLRRVNDVDGASAEQLRWTIRSSTFVEPMERSARS